MRANLFSKLGLTGVVLMATFLSVASPSPAQAVDVFAQLLGKWKGWGWITIVSGGTNTERERVRCNVSYVGGGRRLSQKIVCASRSHKITARGSIARRGRRVVGKWSEEKFKVNGNVSGNITGTGLQLRLTSDSVTIAMDIQTSGRCIQRVVLSPSGIDLRSVTMDLRKRSC